MKTIEPKPYNHAKWSAGRQVFILAVAVIITLCLAAPVLLAVL